jgi:hypothetical protein
MGLFYYFGTVLNTLNLRKFIYILIILICWSCSKHSNRAETTSNPKLDSIQEWIKLAKKSKELSLDDRHSYLNQAKKEVMSLENDTLRLEQLSEISLAYSTLNDSLEFRENNEEVRSMAEKYKIYKVLGYSYWDLASFLKPYGVLDSAYYHYNKALNSFDRLPKDSTSQSLKGRMLYSMAQIQDSYKDYLGAEINVTSALKIFDDLDDQERIHNCYNLLGTIANGRKEIDQALYYYGKVGDYLKKSNPPKQGLIWTNQNNIASALMRVGNYNDAKIAYEKLLSDEELKIKNPKLYVKATSSLAYTLFKQNQNLEKIQYLLD